VELVELVELVVVELVVLVVLVVELVVLLLDEDVVVDPPAPPVPALEPEVVVAPPVAAPPVAPLLVVPLPPVPERIGSRPVTHSVRRVTALAPTSATGATGHSAQMRSPRGVISALVYVVSLALDHNTVDRAAIPGRAKCARYARV
jgi:hypothetical protein